MRRSHDVPLRQRIDAQTRYGNTVNLIGAERETRRSLIWGPKESQLEHDWEQWVFSWRVRNVIENTPADFVCPVARITMGAGGTTVEAFINLVPSGDIQLPSIVSKIDIMWDPELIPNPAFVFPEQLTVDGIIRRGATGSFGRRSILRQAAAPGALPAPVTIPAFSQGLGIDGAFIPYGPAIIYRFTDESTYEFTGPEANAQRALGRLFLIPACSTTITVVNVAPAPETFLGAFDFKIGL